MKSICLKKAVERLPSLYYRVKELEENLKIETATSKIKYTVENYTELLTVSNQEVDDFAFIKSSQGTSWLPGTIGGNYYGKGLYIWTGTVWAEANVEINTALDSLFEEHKEEFITTDYTLPDSSVFKGEIVIKNVGISLLNVNTVTLDKLEGKDTQEIFPGESFTVQKYLPNDYRII